MTRVGRNTLQELYAAFKIMLEKHPEGVDTKSVWQEFFPDYYKGTIEQGTSMLVAEGYLRKEKWGKQVKCVLTGKEFETPPEQPAAKWQPTECTKFSKNKPRRVPDTVQKEVFDAVVLMHTQNPGGVPTTHLHGQMFKDSMSYSYVGSALSELERTGYLASKRDYTGKVYWPTGKHFVSTSPVIPTAREHLRPGVAIPTPKAELFKPKDPSDPNGWVDDMNKVLAALDKLEEAVPGLRLGLLDLSSHLERLSKVKDILAGVEKAARRNL